MIRIIGIALVAAAFLTGCGTVNTGAPVQDPYAQATAADKARAKIEADYQRIKARIESDQAEARAHFAVALQNLNKFAIADLQGAAAMASAHDDPEAAMCWSGLVPIVQAMKVQEAVANGTGIIGPATLAQSIRDLIHGRQTPAASDNVARQINLACAPLYVSARGDIIRVAGMVSAAGFGGPGAAGVAGAIPASLGEAVQLLIQGAMRIR